MQNRPTFLSIQGRKVECAWWGPKHSSRAPIVLLHEGLGCVGLWRGFPDALAHATQRIVMAYSRFGYGASDLPAAPHTPQFMHQEAQLVPRILDAAEIARAILLGHSDGGSIALLAAAEAPQRVAALMLEAPHVFVEDLTVQSIERTTESFRTGNLRHRLAAYHANVDAAFNGWSNVWLHPEFRAWNAEAFVARITCPVLLIQGEDDEYGTLRQVEAIASQIAGKSQQVVLPRCGHRPHHDKPEDVLSAMMSFVQQLE